MRLMLSLLGKLQQNSGDLTPQELVHWAMTNCKYTASAGEDVELLPLLQHLLNSCVVSTSAWM